MMFDVAKDDFSRVDIWSVEDNGLMIGVFVDSHAASSGTEQSCPGWNEKATREGGEGWMEVQRRGRVRVGFQSKKVGEDRTVRLTARNLLL